ncbi:hypothetical protein MLD38_033089 [Melastoma candidum]|uniref:Uncharacterized protein n=1 Tax=Melastoma candidum TaxID=119954 RepID=A0ACB9M6Y1_9MYRT|nr:hypothetical protein MLD38_033089 [Melastoma candidum]
MPPSCSLALLLTLTTSLFHPSTPLTSLVFHGCADRKFPDHPGAYTRNLRSLLSALVSQAYDKPFSNATYGEGDHMITGLYQCRGDLNGSRCGDCVRRIPPLAVRLCGLAIAGRIQLSGCYSRYAVAGFRQDDDTEVLYEVCGKEKAGVGFGDRRDTALGMVESGVSGGEGFYTGEYENVYVVGQCEEDITDGGGDCGSCVTNAVERAKGACGDSISGQVYYSKCFISYSYYPNGVPASTSSGTGHHGTQKTVAVVFGCLAAFGIGIACLMFAVPSFKRRDVKYATRIEY